MQIWLVFLFSCLLRDHVTNPTDWTVQLKAIPMNKIDIWVFLLLCVTRDKLTIASTNSVRISRQSWQVRKTAIGHGLENGLHVRVHYTVLTIL